MSESETMRAALDLPDGLHPKTARMVRKFAAALGTKLRRAEQKYGYADGWDRNDWAAECRAHLFEHIKKGDPLDVAAYCAFMWAHGWSTSLSAPPDTSALDRAYAALKPFARLYGPYKYGDTVVRSNGAIGKDGDRGYAYITVDDLRLAEEVAEELRRLGAKEE